MSTNNIAVFGESQRGCKRGRNDDRFLAKPLDQNTYLLAISDGMGGHPAGNVAAEDIISCLDLVENTSINKSVDLVDAVNKAEDKILHRTKKNPNLEGMGATATATIVNSQRAWWAHIGDCRLYLMREGILKQITKDHTFLQDLIDSGDISLDEASNHPMAHVLDQCVGCIDSGVDSGCFDIFPGDVLLLCSDGLHGIVGDSEIAYILSTEKISNCVDRLVKSSIQAGTVDDTTIIVAYLLPPPYHT